jgi:hypothetical protein
MKDRRANSYDKFALWAIGVCAVLFLTWGIGWIIDPVVRNHRLSLNFRHAARILMWISYDAAVTASLVSRFKATRRYPFDRIVSRLIGKTDPGDSEAAS